MKIVVKVINQDLGEGADIEQFCEDGTYHTDWVYVPGYAKSIHCCPIFFSDTPSHGIGNSYYHTKAQFLDHFGQLIQQRATGAIRDDEDDAFLWKVADATFILLQIMSDTDPATGEPR